ncbi:hypothetical protein VTO42DRAFT_4835 [Malbranchea cinnamomea]
MYVVGRERGNGKRVFGALLICTIGMLTIDQVQEKKKGRGVFRCDDVVSLIVTRTLAITYAQIPEKCDGPFKMMYSV